MLLIFTSGNVVGFSSRYGHGGSSAGSNISCADTDPVDLCPKAEPQEQGGLALYTLGSRLQKYMVDTIEATILPSNYLFL
jgi:hypothetical protein